MSNITALAASPGFNDTINSLITATTGPIADAVNFWFVASEGFLVFMMQLGFALLTVGCVQKKSAKSICLKNLLDASFGVLGYFFFGYAFAYGDSQSCDENGVCTDNENGFIGTRFFALKDFDSNLYQVWYFQYVFAISTATIVSGAVAERVTMLTYALYAFFLTAWVYPVLSHWVWSPSGWASTTRTTGPLFLGTGVYDTVGSGAVHMVGGVAAFMGAWIAGPRIGRFDANGKPRPMPGHNNTFYVTGVLLLWFGFYGTMGQLINPDGSEFVEVVTRCVISTTMGGGFGGVTAVLVYLLYSKVTTGHAVWDLLSAGNGALTGMIVITSGCGTFAPWAAALGGIVGGLIVLPGSMFVSHVCKVDDPVDATTVHMFGGAAGVMWYSLMANENFVHELYGPTNPDGVSPKAYGWWLGGGPTIVWANLVWVLVIFGWVGFWMGGFFYIMKLGGLLRVPASEEMVGMDVSHHGGACYVDEFDLEQSNGNGNGVDADPAGKLNHLAKKSPNELESEIELLRSDLHRLANKLTAMEAGGKAVA